MPSNQVTTAELSPAVATVLSALTARRDGERIKPRLYDMVTRELLRTLRDPELYK